MKQVKTWLLGALLAVMLTDIASASHFARGQNACNPDVSIGSGLRRVDESEFTNFAEEAEEFGLSEASNAYERGQDAYHAGDYAVALAEFTPLAEAGDVDAQYYLGYMYANGRGVAQDDAEAVKWYRLAADAGNATAQYNLGEMYANGEGVAQNDAEAVRWWLLAAEAGYDRAQFNLGHMYLYGKGIAQDDAEAWKWYRLAAVNFHPMAEAGDVERQFNLGQMYAGGMGVVQDDSLAYMWYSLAAARGNEKALKNRDRVAIRMIPAQLAEAQFNLGEIYLYGRGVAEDCMEAVKWLHLAAEGGNAEAQLTLGDMYHHGEGVAQDVTQVMKWYRLAAEAGNTTAQFYLGEAYLYGYYGVANDDAEAFKWLRSAAEARHLVAKNLLAGMYYDGRGVAQDYRLAYVWDILTEGSRVEIAGRMTIEQFAEAQTMLGERYSEGKGVEQDNSLAYMWFSLAAAQGNKTAKENRDKVAKRMTAEQIAEAEKIAEDCRARNYKYCQ